MLVKAYETKNLTTSLINVMILNIKNKHSTAKYFFTVKLHRIKAAHCLNKHVNKQAINQLKHLFHI